ncbi:hypothetical protein K443DRAFT_110393 [Laccaria amethystina LaAM-08-1]|uniref:Unplaced genomic scaffold K443scaffold_258, whole genome shotgun sequence n=1 Tax=Laccaria amethystina LaAM-08-1 TaxID=1095629 RepID=A0A0C9X9V1_9AGAR|nr:hypothetical protein K443DRAFT_110393 [Laccaria amethystina LaAM-08-1]
MVSSPGIHRPHRACRLLKLALIPEDWKQTLALSEPSKRLGFWTRFSSLDPTSQAADTPMPSLVWDRFACGSTSSDPLVHSDQKALSVQIMTESSRRITPSMSSPEGSLTLCGTAQLVRLSFDVVHPEVSTLFLHTVDRPKRMGSIVDGNPSTMPTERMLENVRGMCHREE